MKKINYIILLILALNCLESFSQNNVADFENLNLSTDSYWDGSDLTGVHNNSVFISDFSSGNCNFSNSYDTTWGQSSGYWSAGWVYSNMTDSTTSGFTNQFSAKAGGGHPIGGANYAIGKSNSTIIFTQPSGFSINITNTTYAANSMRDGDAFAKKFTNTDQDYFKLHIYGYSNGSILDSTEFYLANFTNADSSLDYIVTDWQYVELPSGTYDSVSFNLNSSDVGAFGMNTPNYFCIDNVGDYPLAIINENLIGISPYPNPTRNFISFTNIENVSKFRVSIFDFHGKEIIRNQSNPTKINLSSLKSGQYIIKIESEGSIKHEKIIKI